MEERNLVKIKAGEVFLKGNLEIPDNATAVVLFAHGSGSSRHSPRNRMVAQELKERGLGTLLIDLLTPEEEEIDEKTHHLRFDIDLLTRRLVFLIDWLKAKKFSIGLFGASTGAAAALAAAAERPRDVKAVVSRGGRPDLAAEALSRVTAPTLLIVGGEDSVVISLNQQALDQLRCEKQLVIIPGASHLFEERGALEQVAQTSASWFTVFLRS